MAGVDSRWRFPAQDIENYITQYFDLPPEYWEEILRVDEAYDAQNHTYAYNTRYLSSCLPYLTEARQEGGFPVLVLRYHQFLWVYPGTAGSISGHPFHER